MVWEQKPALIVMIAEENEVAMILINNIISSINEQTIPYWSDAGELVHQVCGSITVTVKLRASKPDHTITTFRVSHSAVSR